MRQLTKVSHTSSDEPQGQVGQAVEHDSAQRHVSGQALYVDDLPEPRGTLYAAVIASSIAQGQILELDLQAVREAAGVVAVLTLEDVPGKTDIGPVYPGDPILTSDHIAYFAQPIALVAAETEDQARQAAQRARIEYAAETPVLNPLQALEEGALLRPSHQMQRGEPDKVLAQSERQLHAEMQIGGQEHFYLEGQVSLAQPTEEGGMLIYTSSQHPTEVQNLVAEVLGVPFSQVTVEMRRMGGGFGGKETQAAPWACLAALMAYKTGRPVKLRLPRQQDMRMTGKRHPFINRYHLALDAQGRIQAADIEVIGNGGHSPDLTDAIVDRAMFHADNAYYLPQVRIRGHRVRTACVSHTAFRGFGGPQGMLIIERAMDDIARKLALDPLDVRKRNLYGVSGAITPYGQNVEQPLLPLIEALERSSDYRARRQEIQRWNLTQPCWRRGLALTPVKFGISFTLQHLNQAGALLHLYTDGSVQLNHGGTEMGQGLHTKVAQIVATALGIPISRIQITATRTDKVPNTSPTAASSGADLNGQAALAAAQTLKQRLIDFLAQREAVPAESIEFAQGQVSWGSGQSLSFAELVQAAYQARISLSATGYYRTPKIYYNRAQAQGRPFFYFALGAAVSEVLVDTLTGESRVLRVDILHDVGKSLNPALDIGQIEGGFIQGMGWLTSEELVWNAEGRLLSDTPATYKIPAISDTPPIFNVALYPCPNPEASIYRSKAVGEPPLMLAISVWSALRDAISSLSDYRLSPDLDPPATPEKILWAIEDLHRQMRGAL